MYIYVIILLVVKNIKRLSTSVEEVYNMKLIIDTDKKIIEVPSDFKGLYDNQRKMNKMLGKEDETLSSMIDLSKYSVVAKQNRVIKDTTNAKTIDEFMNSVKEKDADKYNAYIELKNKQVGTSKNGKPLKTSFLVIKKWFYENYPKQNPFKNK